MYNYRPKVGFLIRPLYEKEGITYQHKLFIPQEFVIGNFEEKEGIFKANKDNTIITSNQTILSLTESVLDRGLFGLVKEVHFMPHDESILQLTEYSYLLASKIVLLGTTSRRDVQQLEKARELVEERVAALEEIINSKRYSRFF
ncbi:MAG: hypothetical protein KC535_02480 [Nanoarchaeota archaeon]|nr:hypothetical protein [Nanoarchaeota archaeon]